MLQFRNQTWYVQVIPSLSVINKRLQVSVRLASKILGYKADLKTAISSSSYDFSALYAISNWLLDILNTCSPTFDHLLEQSKALHSAVSLSTGLGLFALWSNMYIDESPKSLLESVKLTNEMASSLKVSSNVSGECNFDDN